MTGGLAKTEETSAGRSQKVPPGTDTYGQSAALLIALEACPEVCSHTQALWSNKQPYPGPSQTIQTVPSPIIPASTLKATSEIWFPQQTGLSPFALFMHFSLMENGCGVCHAQPYSRMSDLQRSDHKGAVQTCLLRRFNP